MKSLKESILKSNSAGLDWLSKEYNEFKLFRVAYMEGGKSMIPKEETIDEFFDIDNVIELRGPFLKTCNTLPASPEKIVKKHGKFYQSIGNILYNCKFDDDELNKKLKDFIKPGVKVFTEKLEMQSGNNYFYYTFVKDKTKELEFGYKCSK